ncbi:MAG: anthranilate phosphoribosyltransferase [Anaerolineae bacterium]|nr:anthranilate phosphoribosyltransferase [Anaerolineae bacterium]
MQELLSILVAGKTLTTEQTAGAFERIMTGQASPVQVAALLSMMQLRGPSVEEITGAAQVMRAKVHSVKSPKGLTLIDTCGTGGDHGGTFNISTAAAIIAAGAARRRGVAVAKHGNRSVSSQSGSADVLEALGIRLDLEPEVVAQSIDEVGFGFLFAPKLHPAMRHAIGPRREMGIRTIFNFLGPLCNPAGARMQVMGVPLDSLVQPLAGVLKTLGSQAAFVVHGADGLDELSTTGVNRLARFGAGGNDEVVVDELDAMGLGLPRVSLADLKGGTAQENSELTVRVLKGERGPRRDVVLLNAAAALVAGGKAGSLPNGLQAATDLVDSGAALGVLRQAVEFSRASA